MSSINRILRNRAAERAAAEFARAAGYGLYSAVSAAGSGVSAPSYPFPWGAPLHPHWPPGAGAPGLTPPGVAGHLAPTLATPPAAASSPHRSHVNLSGSESASPLASPHHAQGLGSLPAGFAAFAAAAAAAAAAAREANTSSATPHGSGADSVQESVSPATSPRGRPSSHGTTRFTRRNFNAKLSYDCQRKSCGEILEMTN